MTSQAQPRRLAVRPSPVFLIVLALTALGGYLSWTATTYGKSAGVAVSILVLAGWVLSLCLHEFAHAFSAWRAGDLEVEARGYLTLNPLKYANPLLSIILPLFFIAIGGIGLPGGAVYLHTHLFKSKWRQSLTSLVGPLVNVAFAVVLLAVIPRRLDLAQSHSVFWFGLSFLALLQVMASVLNLLPVPGLDGWGALEPFLSQQTRNSAQQFKSFGLLAVFALLQVQTVNSVFFSFIYNLFDLSGVSRDYAAYGHQLFQFWKL